MYVLLNTLIMCSIVPYNSPNPPLNTTHRARFGFCGKAESCCFSRHSNRYFRIEVALNSDSAAEIPSKIFVANTIANNPQLEESFCFWAVIIVTGSFPSLSRSDL